MPRKRNPLAGVERRANALAWERLAGLRCICAPGCTDIHWGDQRKCARGCEPCKRMRGQTYHPPPKAGKAPS